MKKIYTFALAMAMTFAMGSAMAQTYKYVKVTEEPADWTGTYLIVYEADDDNNVAYVFNGALEAKDLDSKGNFFEASNPAGEDGVRFIESNAQTDAAVFNISDSPSSDYPAYCIQSASGYYIGYDNEDKGEPNLEYSNEHWLDNTIAMEEGKTSVNIFGRVSTYQLRFNNDEGKQRFRYHETGKKKSIKLYQKVEVSGTGIANVEGESASKQVYNLQGQPVNGMQKGLNVVDGKVILK